MTPIMKLGIVGSGKIVQECLETLAVLDEVACTALCVRSHSLDKGQGLANRYDIGQVFTDYAQFLAEADVDMVYIGLVNSVHFVYVRQALEAGRHVICEKPFTSTFAEAQQLADLARQKELFLLEAITMCYFPNFAYLRQKVQEIGEIRLVQCNYSQYSSRYDQYRQGNVLPAFDPALSGGALYDINVYNVHFVTALFGRPQQIHYVANLGFNGIDTSGVLLMRYPDFIATCHGAKDSQSPSAASVQGTDGYVQLTSAPNTALGVLTCIRGELETINLHQHNQHMFYEFKAFADMFHRGDKAAGDAALAHTLDVMWVLSQARQDAGIVFGADHA